MPNDGMTFFLVPKGTGCLGSFRGQDIDHFNVGRAGPQIGVSAQGGGYLAGEVGFAAGFIGKSIENTERGRTQAQGVPGSGSGFGFHNGQGPGQKIGYGLLMTGFYFEAN